MKNKKALKELFQSIQESEKIFSGDALFGDLEEKFPEVELDYEIDFEDVDAKEWESADTEEDLTGAEERDRKEDEEIDYEWIEEEKERIKLLEEYERIENCSERYREIRDEEIYTKIKERFGELYAENMRIVFKSGGIRLWIRETKKRMKK